eukprot:5800328-Amphidinium_carterae.1
MEKRAYSNEDPEALKQYKWYVEGNQRLDKDLREEYEKYHGVLEDTEAYQEAIQNKDRGALRNIIFEYAAGVRERKLFWRQQKLIEHDKKKEMWKTEVLREQAEKAEEEKQRRKRTRGLVEEKKTQQQHRQQQPQHKKRLRRTMTRRTRRGLREHHHYLHQNNTGYTISTTRSTGTQPS